MAAEIGKSNVAKAVAFAFGNKCVWSAQLSARKARLGRASAIHRALIAPHIC